MSALAAVPVSSAEFSATGFAPRPAPPTPPLFVADVEGEDTLGRAASARLLADLTLHPGAGTPFLIAVHGTPGSGKSSFLKEIARLLRDAGASGGTPVVAEVDASSGMEAQAGLMAGLHAGLRTSDPDLAEEALHAGGDPLRSARAASDRVADLRRQLDAERRALDDLTGRQAHLVDTVLFKTPGSRVDAYARANRASIEGRLRAFGLSTVDPVATYKEEVRESAETNGGASRFGLTLRALWAYKGQGRLIVLALLLLVFGWGCGDLADNQDVWGNWLQGLGDKFAGLAAWAQDHAAWLPLMSHACYALAALAILIAIIRAFRFIQPVMRGASLLQGELDARRRDIDGLLAHQIRRVDHGAAEVEAAVRAAEAAERRVEARRAAGMIEAAPASLDGSAVLPTSPQAPADAFLNAVGLGLSGNAQSAGPSRVVVIIDELDQLPASAAAAHIDTAHRMLRRPGFVTLVAVDRHHVLDGFSETDPAFAASRLGRCVQLSFDLDAEAAAARSLGPSAEASALADALDRPWQDHEAQLLAALSVFAGPNPRATKRFANTYRVARADPKMADATPSELAGLAIALALDESGAAAELGVYEVSGGRSQGGEPSGSDLDAAVAAAQAAVGIRFIPVEARRGLQVARIYSRRG